MTRTIELDADDRRNIEILAKYENLPCSRYAEALLDCVSPKNEI